MFTELDQPRKIGAFFIVIDPQRDIDLGFEGPTEAVAVAEPAPAKVEAPKPKALPANVVAIHGGPASAALPRKCRLSIGRL